MQYKRLSYSVIWSDEDQEYVGLCAEFPSLSCLAATRDEALSGIKRVVGDVLADMQTNEESVPINNGAKVEIRKEDGATVLERFRKAIKRERQNGFYSADTEKTFCREE